MFKSFKLYLNQNIDLEILTKNLIDFNYNYKYIGNYINNNIDHYLKEANHDYTQHARLIHEWPELIQRAKNIYLPDLLGEPKVMITVTNWNN